MNNQQTALEVPNRRLAITKLKLPIVLITVIVLSLVGCSQNKEADNYKFVASEDATMNAAVEKAKATVDDFVRAFHAQKAGAKDYFVKKPYQTPTGGMEHMWIEVLKEENGVLNGRIANDAEETREVSRGQMVSLQTSEISDWKYQDGNKLIGGFTIRYFIEKMSPKERETFLKEAGFNL